MLPRQEAAKQAMHPRVRIGHRHRAGRVAVITALEGHERGTAAQAAIGPVLDGHLHGDLDRD